MNTRDVLSRVAVGILAESEEEVLEFIRGWLEQKLADVTVEDMVVAIDEGKDLWDDSPGRYRVLAEKLASQHRKLYDKYRAAITTDRILAWFAEDRPDLANFIVNDRSQKAYRWFDGMVDKIRTRLFEQANPGI